MKTPNPVILSEAKDLSLASYEALCVKDPSPSAQDDRM